jgi:hypothetical protein
VGLLRGIALLFLVPLVAAIVGLQLRSVSDPMSGSLASPLPSVSSPLSSDPRDFPDASAYAQMSGISLEEAI